MKPAVRDTLPIVLLPIVLVAAFVAMIALLALGVKAASEKNDKLTTGDGGFTVTVPADKALAQRLEDALSEWLKIPPPNTPAITAEIKRLAPVGRPPKSVVVLDL